VGVEGSLSCQLFESMTFMLKAEVLHIGSIMMFDIKALHKTCLYSA
jgi:hypothetical protein